LKDSASILSALAVTSLKALTSSAEQDALLVHPLR
jgi:hypothetical protein